ncbi:hypothetical protein L1987_54455 [Smallanthus sonchifolius]|uniref:Uncharacterized protein n=1 Tax=Smallanthus sonchifolius TaxID=185202 RepID=A0ACB9E7V7_9ASTR|nr:hypothetical protein L1987_54455 [Smallanthus sonchifolius]
MRRRRYKHQKELFVAAEGMYIDQFVFCRRSHGPDNSTTRYKGGGLIYLWEIMHLFRRAPLWFKKIRKVYLMRECLWSLRRYNKIA